MKKRVTIFTFVLLLISINAFAQSCNLSGSSPSGGLYLHKILTGNSSDDDSPHLFATSGRKLYFGTNGVIATPRMVIDTAGNVGIGTTTPQTPLHVIGDITVGNSTTLFNAGGTGTAPSIHMGTSLGADGSALFLSGGGAAGALSINDASRGAYLNLLGNDIGFLGGCAVLGGGNSENNLSAVALATKGEMRVYVSSEGNVGIGTTSPEATLDVTGTVKAFGDWDSTRTLNNGNPYQAESDGFVVVVATISSAGAYVNGYTDGNSVPTTIRGYVINPGGSFTMPVKKGDYWKITTSGTIGSLSISWLPLGHQ